MAKSPGRASLPAKGLERVVFSDAREPLPLKLHDYRTQQVRLNAVNLQPGILASCSIPFWLRAVRNNWSSAVSERLGFILYSCRMMCRF